MTDNQVTPAELKQAVKDLKIDTPILDYKRVGSTLVITLLGGTVVKYTPKGKAK